jgi:hypothetical protein
VCVQPSVNLVITAAVDTVDIGEVVAKQYIITEHLCWNSHTVACKSRHSRTTSCGGDLTVICRETDDNGGSTNEEDEW